MIRAGVSCLGKGKTMVRFRLERDYLQEFVGGNWINVTNILIEKKTTNEELLFRMILDFLYRLEEIEKVMQILKQSAASIADSGEEW